MALPTTVVSDVGRSGHRPPMKTSGGSFYVVAIDDTNDVCEVWKADGDDPTDAWTEQDSANSVECDAPCVSCILDGDLIHIVHIIGVGVNNRGVRYHQFDTSSDTWSVDNEVIESTMDAAQSWASISVRSDGDVFVTYNSSTDRVMGGDKERADGNQRTSGTWGGPFSLDAGGDVHYGNPNCILGTNDSTHFMWLSTADTANDPPTAWTDTGARTVSSGDVLSTTQTNGADSGGVLLGSSNILSYDDGGTQRIINIYGLDTSANMVRGTEDGGDDISSLNSTSPVFNDEPPNANGEVSTHSLTNLDDVIHIIFANDVDLDVYTCSSTDDGSTFSTRTEIIDAVTCNFISSAIYTRGVDTVLAYVYDDAGVQKYNEHVLISGATAFLPLFDEQQNTLLRM